MPTTTAAGRVLSACACAAALLASAAAHASAGFAAELTNLGFSLTDLDPDDGIAPSFTLPAQLGSAAVSGVGAYIWSPSHYAGDLSGLDPAQSAVGAAGTDLSRTASLGDNAQITAQALGSTYLLISSVGAGQTGNGNYIAGAGIASGSIYDESFGAGQPSQGSIAAVLSPHTQLTVTIDFSLSLQGTLDCFQCDYESHGVGAYLGLLAGHDDEAFLGHFDQIYNEASLDFSRSGSDPLYESYDQSGSGTLQVTYYNTTDDTIGIRVLGGLRGGGSWQAGAIPEPSTYALVGLGLGGAAWWARRRKAGSAA